jgi:hypothetical protein
MRASILLLLALFVLGAAGCAAPAEADGDLPEDPSERHLALLHRAWGPESPETLEHYLATREQIVDRYRKFEHGLRQLALREASTQPLFGPALLGAGMLRKDLENALEERGLTFADYQRLTMLVYGRWLRAVRDQPLPERRVVRVLQELEAALERRLERNPPEAPEERAQLENRLASVRHQKRFVSEYIRYEPVEVLERIDPATRSWLEEHRARIEDLDFGLFDTMAPPRSRPEASQPPGGPAENAALPTGAGNKKEGGPPRLAS